MMKLHLFKNLYTILELFMYSTQNFGTGERHVSRNKGIREHSAGAVGMPKTAAQSVCVLASDMVEAMNHVGDFFGSLYNRTAVHAILDENGAVLGRSELYATEGVFQQAAHSEESSSNSPVHMPDLPERKKIEFSKEDIESKGLYSFFSSLSVITSCFFFKFASLNYIELYRTFFSTTYL
ncbi:hypothetical protein KIN20_003554 [Parelaphostrongylus tenuis]|uniref:Uncharacterized protein n=1 Tax=Parelaphostrongylus tenuis TaxID=148309 RepID=A0AAD5MIJ6_PARTN|nr:hypothetical protein KIN20_003554 [Parelaphostrongylus tenuis]